MIPAFFQKPQINLSRSTPERMWILAGAAFCATLQSSLSDSFRSLTLAAAVLAGALLTDVVFAPKGERFRWIGDGSAAASALVLVLFLPNELHPLFGFFGAVFAAAVVRNSFGGLGSNWLNPAACGWLFIRTAWPGAFNAGLEHSYLSRLGVFLERGFDDGSPLLLLRIAGWQGNFGAVEAFLNRTVFSWSGTALPDGYLAFLSAPGPGIIADRGLFFLMLGMAFFAASRSFRLWLPPLYLAAYLFLAKAFGALPFGGSLWSGDALFALLSGGTIAAAFILIADPASGPKSVPGYICFALFTAFFAALFRFPGGEPYGAVPAVLLGNAFVPLIRRLENVLHYEKRRCA